MTPAVSVAAICLCVTSVAMANPPGQRLHDGCLVDRGLEAYRCDPDASTGVCRLRSGTAHRFHGAAVEIADAELDNGAIVAAQVQFGESAFDRVAASLRIVLGEPEDHGEPLRGGMGGLFDNAVWVWRIDGAVVVAEQFAGRISRSVVSCMTPSAFAGFEATRARQRSNGSRDL